MHFSLLHFQKQYILLYVNWTHGGERLCYFLMAFCYVPTTFLCGHNEQCHDQQICSKNVYTYKHFDKYKRKHVSSLFFLSILLCISENYFYLISSQLSSILWSPTLLIVWREYFVVTYHSNCFALERYYHNIFLLSYLSLVCLSPYGFILVKRR